MCFNMGIGTLRETSLHAGLKEWYKQPGDSLEVPVDGYIIDIVRGELLIEIQTRNFSSIKKKLHTLVKKHRVRLVHPISAEKWIVRERAADGHVLGRRRSPKRLGFYNIFDELVRIPKLIAHQNFELEILLIKEEEKRKDDGKGTWKRRGWSISDRVLLEVIENRVYSNPSDFSEFIPEGLERPFTTTDLAEAAGITKTLARRTAYCLRKVGILTTQGKRGNAILYT